MKINIPHIHKIEGDSGFWAEISKTGEVKQLKLNALEGLRQIEGILIGRRAQDIPTIVSRVCGICPVVHILNACCAIESALEIRVPEAIILIRKLMLASQIIQSHTLHLFFMSLPDFLDLENDAELTKKFPKESKAAMAIRDFSMGIIEAIGGRKVHPLTLQVGGLLKLPGRRALQDILVKSGEALDSAVVLAESLKNISYPETKKETKFLSVYSKTEYPFYRGSVVRIGEEKITAGDFYSNQIEEDFRHPPIKRVGFRGQPYMLGAIARLKNNSDYLNPLAEKYFREFCRQKGSKVFSNVFHNLFFQLVEVLHFIEETPKLINQILSAELQEMSKDIATNPGSGLSAMEAPRGTLFTYFEIDDQGRISDCNIITPTAQFLNNLEADLRVFLPKIMDLNQEEKEKKIKSLIRAYDPCISCATH